MPKSRSDMYWVESRRRWRKRIVLQGKQRDVYGKTKNEVNIKIKELSRQNDAGLILDDSTTLLGFIKQWFPAKTSELRKNTVEIYRTIINAHIAPFFKDMLLRDIRTLRRSHPMQT